MAVEGITGDQDTQPTTPAPTIPSPLDAPLPFSLEDRVTQMAKAAPALASDPVALLTAARSVPGNPDQAGRALTFAAKLNDAATKVETPAQYAAKASQLQEAFGAVLNDPHATQSQLQAAYAAWHQAANASADAPQPSLWNSTVGDTVRAARGVGAGAVALGTGLYHAAYRTGETAVEVGTAGLVGPDGYGPGAMSANQQDAINSVTNLAEAFNPFNQQKGVYYLPGHIISAYEEMERRYGASYTAGFALPAVVAALVSDGTLGTGAEAGSSADLASQASLLERASDIVRSGGTLTDREAASVSTALEKLRTAALSDNRLNEIEDAAKARGEQMAERAPLRSIVAKGMETISRPLGLVSKGLHVLSAPARNILSNSFYLASGAAIATAHPDIWHQTTWNSVHVPNTPEQVAQLVGVVHAARDVLASGQSLTPIQLAAYHAAETTLANGQTVSNIGVLEQAVGISPTSMFYQPLADIGTVYEGAFLTDPVASLGHLPALARLGFTGKLGEFWGGLAITDSSDIERTARQYPSVARAYNFMATHSALEIVQQFKGTITRGVADAIVADRVGLTQGQLYDSVINTMGRIADGRGLVVSRTPTLGLYSDMKLLLRGSLGERFGTLGNALSMDHVAMAQWRDVTVDGLRPFRDDGALYAAASNDPALRFRVLLRQRFARVFNDVPRWIDEGTNRWTTSVIEPGSTNAIAAIQQNFRNALMPEETVKAVGEFLYASNDPADYVNAYRQSTYHAVLRRALAGMDRTALDSLGPSVEKSVWDYVASFTGADGGGKDGYIVAGPRGEWYSRVYDDPNALADNPHAEGVVAALNRTQLGSLRLIPARDLTSLGDGIRSLLLRYGSDARDMTVALRDLSTLTETARYSDASLASVRSSWDAVLRARRAALQSGEVAGVDRASYTATNRALRRYAASLAAQDLTDPERFTTLYDTVTRQRDAVRAQLTGADAARPALGATAHETAVLRAQEAALSDLLEGMNSTLRNTTTFTAADLRGFAERMADQRGLTAEAKDDFASTMVDKLRTQRSSEPMFRSPWQRTVDFANRLMSRTFVPLALLSEGWAIRVSLSEVVLNGFRLGWGDYFDAKVMSSVLRHETDLGDRVGFGILDKYPHATLRKLRVMIRDVVAGGVLGIERSYLNGMDEAERLRLLDHSAATIIRNQGYLPGQIHSAGKDVVDSGYYGRSMAEKLWTATRNGESQEVRAIPSGDIASYAARQWTDTAYVNGLREHLSRMAHDTDLTRPAATDVYTALVDKGMEALRDAPTEVAARVTEEVRAYYRSGDGVLEVARHGMPDVNQLVTEAMKGDLHAGPVRDALAHIGAARFDTAAARDELMAQVQRSTLARLRAMPPDSLRRLNRSYMFLGKTGERDPLEDFAEAIAYNAVHSVSGDSPLIGADGTHVPVFHADLARQVSTGVIRDPQSLARQVSEMGQTSPIGIPGKGFETYHALQYLAGPDLLRVVSEAGHEKVLGPVVNAISRDPIWLIENHRAMEPYEDMIADGIIDRDSAQSLAESQAMRTMSKYVHNPKDKLVFEANMRVLAPFYFAQVQAYRRALRLLGDDPGAFERYLKLCLSITNYIGTASQGGSEPSVYLPGATWIGAAAGMGIPGLTASIGGLAIGLTGDPGSVQTVVPTGAVNGLGILGTFARPAWGPLVTIPLKEFRDTVFANNAEAVRITNNLLGPISSETSIGDDIVANTSFRNIWNLLDMGPLGNKDNAAYISAMNLTIGARVSQMYISAYEQAHAANAPYYDEHHVSQAEQVTLDRAEADTAFAQQFATPAQQQQFLDETSMHAMQLYALKTALSLGAPIALSLKAVWDQEPKLQALLAETANGKPRYTLVQAYDEFASRYPQDLVSLVSRTDTDYETYPETLGAIQFLTRNRAVVEKYPYAASYLIPNTGRAATYSAQAYQVETSMGLRQEQSPQGYLDAVLNYVGEDYYYDYLYPTVEANPVNVQSDGAGGVDLSYTGISKLDALAKSYGTMSNPTWYAEQFGVAKGNIALQALNQMSDLVDDDPHAFAPGDQAKFKWLIDGGTLDGQSSPGYKGFINEYHQLKAQGANTAADNLESEWYDYYTAAAQSPYFAQQSTFITSVLRKMPSR